MRQPEGEAACALCRRADSDSELFGQTCHQDGLCVHENCLYHASGLSQRGADGEGFYGFLLPDIRQELKRAAHKTCCICRRRGASVACQGRRCPRNFHFPCGGERGCVSQFFGEFKSFCWQHRPVQRLRALRRGRSRCLICQEPVAGRPRFGTLVCPACRSAWFHRACIQGQALRSALHHFRCPLCQDTDTFQAEMFRLGIQIPDRDAAWELEGAFDDHYRRHSSCDAARCLCPGGRQQADDEGPWRLLLCNSCGSRGTHRECGGLGEEVGSWECGDCAGAGTGWGSSQNSRHATRLQHLNTLLRQQRLSPTNRHTLNF
ncbi:PHD finger protein 7-like [Nothoprocta perdicaria]|uniref:PHD finger protein 7-like n=1 Tax=Nothoprocta perdicaria TaxID=30464 RepID=UPI000E1C2BC1|nr:PHD finger protein 7-like [Nothoprocta perdicaria]